MSRYTNPTPLPGIRLHGGRIPETAHQTDADNAVKRISYDVPYEEYQVEYDIVVGNEVIDEAMNHPEFPEEEKLYKYEIKNRTKNQNTRHRKPGNDRDHLPIVPEKFSKETIKR